MNAEVKILSIKFFWDDGSPEVYISGDDSLLECFFSMDISTNKEYGELLLKHLAEFQTGVEESPAFLGECHWLELDKETVEIHSDFSPAKPNPLILPFKTFHYIAKRYQEFISQPRTKEPMVFELPADEC